MRQIIPLNFQWKYSPDFSEDMFKKSYNDSGFESVDIPHANLELPYNYFDEKSYQFVSCYRKHFRLPDTAFTNGRHILLHFEGAANYSRVFVNGKPAGEHKGGYTPFVFDITELVCTKENIISVMLDSTERSEIPPFGRVVDYLGYGGIYREVWLEITEAVYIKDVFVKTPDALNAKKTVEADITFSEKTSGTLALSIYDGEKLLDEKKCDFDAEILSFKWKTPLLKLWSINAPQLYTLKIDFNGDITEKRFGVREARFTKNGFFLNGEHIKLRGLNRHQSYPYVGNAMPASAQYADAELMKYTLGCNFVRTAHYPDSTHFIDRCDEIGLLVFTEMPSWQFLGEDEWRENCLDNIEKMIIRDRSHPSIILWGVRVNEGNDCDEFYTQTNALARTLDPTRQTGGVRNFPRSHLLEDVYTYNDFSHSGGKIHLLPPALVTGLKAPYLVTEYNGHMFPTKSFDRESLRTEQALRHARVQDASEGNRRICGATGWCMADYNTHKDFGSGDKICYHGVTDMFRIPKLAASVYASQQDDTPVLETSSSMDIGDYPGGIVGPTYIFTNCDWVVVYKNGKQVSKAYPNYNKFPHLKHPPICPEDYIGDALVRDEGLDQTTAKYLKAALVAAGKYGFIMPPQNYLKIAFAFLHGRMSFKQIVDLVTKYFANWGDEQVEYKFEGYKDGVAVKTVTRTAVNSKSLEIKADSSSLFEADTYDVTRIVLRAHDQNNNNLPYANNAVKITVDGPARVIGPDSFALVGGVRAFWIRTQGKSGTVKITVDAEGFEAQTLEISVIKK